MNPRERTDPGLAFNERTAAFLLDYLILGGAAFLAGGGGLSGILALLAASFLNQGVLTAFTGYSLGKAISGVRAARVDSTDPPGVVPGLVRWVLLNVDVLFFGLVGLIVSSRSPRRQRVGDIAARTWVVGGAPAPRYRAIAGVLLPLLCLALLFVRSTSAGWAVAGILVPVGVGVTVIVAGLMTPWFGVARAQATLDWVASAGPLLMRLDACVGIAMGGFVVYVFRAPTRRAP